MAVLWAGGWSQRLATLVAAVRAVRAPVHNTLHPPRVWHMLLLSIMPASALWCGAPLRGSCRVRAPLQVSASCAANDMPACVSCLLRCLLAHCAVVHVCFTGRGSRQPAALVPLLLLRAVVIAVVRCALKGGPGRASHMYSCTSGCACAAFVLCGAPMAAALRVFPHLRSRFARCAAAARGVLVGRQTPA